jgi:hypothetical protein
MECKRLVHLLQQGCHQLILVPACPLQLSPQHQNQLKHLGLKLPQLLLHLDLIQQVLQVEWKHLQQEDQQELPDRELEQCNLKSPLKVYSSLRQRNLYKE